MLHSPETCADCLSLCCFGNADTYSIPDQRRPTLMHRFLYISDLPQLTCHITFLYAGYVSQCTRLPRSHGILCCIDPRRLHLDNRNIGNMTSPAGREVRRRASLIHDPHLLQHIHDLVRQWPFLTGLNIGLKLLEAACAEDDAVLWSQCTVMLDPSQGNLSSA